ncbi:DUF4040 family protein [Bogoriella caseilytica]|uniref:Multisubunit sodium/proton antiporter MrpA subunit /multisubunit sodium/proton antiporter MrpB subunit n=1 Tax=Bogoriella caseilytica TaxID=56055 RepID=A0A3N2BAL0_9MICO|nr:DUF4040 family protein [Bogoriella caseilytica]ROR72228.1 multisubunit sodium/proton antiporter MrpA subunit /multisubunit sodium/proton antiporter MrpB subunit [Bogoriella caseilytica]
MSLTLILLLALAIVAIAPVLGARMGRAAGWPLAAAMGGLTALIAFQYPGADAVTESLAWLPTLGVDLSLRLDGLSFLFALVVTGIGAVVMIFSSHYLYAGGRESAFYTLMTFFAAAMLLLVLADDIVVMFVAWEFTTLCSYLLIVRSGPKAPPPATRTLLVTVAGGLALLAAVCLMWATTGTTVLSEVLAHEAWTTNGAFAAAVAVLIAVAAMTKSAQFPFHAWLPDAMVAPAPVSAYLHAAAMVKAGIYLLMRFADAASNSPAWSALLISVGLLTAFIGALFALQRTDLKELLAYSTVSQLGLLVATIGVGTPGAMLAATLHVLAHALFKSAAFMHVGYVEKRFGSRDIRDLHGLWRASRWESSMIVLAAASMAGIIPMLGFISKELVLDSMAGEGTTIEWFTVIAATLGAVLTVAYSARMVVTTLPGKPKEALKPWRDLSGASVAISISAIAGTVLGVAVWLIDDLIRPAAAVTAQVPIDDVDHLYLWHGVNEALVLSILAIAGGVAITVWRTRVDRLLVGRKLWPFTGVAAVQGTIDSIISFGSRVGGLTRYDAPAGHLAIPAVLVGAGGAISAVLWRGIPDTGPVDPIDVGLLVAITFGVLLVVRSRVRLTALIAVGVVGFAVAIWFYTLGAADVALTQLLVEILTVVIIVLVIRRMRQQFQPTPGRRIPWAALAAVAAGVSATLAALVFTGHRELSAAGEYFLENVYPDTGGSNVVNTILVDYRALDTLGEVVVLVIAAVSMAALISARPAVGTVDGAITEAGGSGLRAPAEGAPLTDSVRNAVFLKVVERALVPLLLVGSAWVLLRGHNDPGGGFIGALVGVAAFALLYLAAPSDLRAGQRLDLSYLRIAGAGIAIGVISGLLGLFDGSFLRPLHADVLGIHLTSALIFDVGVYLGVVGVILAALVLLGTPQPELRNREMRTGEAPPDDPPATGTTAAPGAAENAPQVTTKEGAR